MNEVIIAVDPGRDKCGVAVVDRMVGALWKKVIRTGELAAVVAELAGGYGADTVIVGDRTAHRQAVGVLDKITIAGKKLSIKLVDEHRSTEEARKLYWQENPPRGLRRLLPVTMLTPPVPVDDYVAVVLARRYFVK